MTSDKVASAPAATHAATQAATPFTTPATTLNGAGNGTNTQKSARYSICCLFAVYNNWGADV